MSNELSPKRHPTFSLFLTKEQVDIAMRALDGTGVDTALPSAEYQAMFLAKRDLRQKLVNLKIAIKRRETKPKESPDA